MTARWSYAAAAQFVRASPPFTISASPFPFIVVVPLSAAHLPRLHRWFAFPSVSTTDLTHLSHTRPAGPTPIVAERPIVLPTQSMPECLSEGSLRDPTSRLQPMSCLQRLNQLAAEAGRPHPTTARQGRAEIPQAPIVNPLAKHRAKYSWLFAACSCVAPHAVTKAAQSLSNMSESRIRFDAHDQNDSFEAMTD